MLSCTKRQESTYKLVQGVRLCQIATWRAQRCVDSHYDQHLQLIRYMKGASVSIFFNSDHGDWRTKTGLKWPPVIMNTNMTNFHRGELKIYRNETVAQTEAN